MSAPTCECDPSLPARDRCGDGFVRCNAGIRAGRHLAAFGALETPGEPAPAPRTLPVTPAERACATVLRAWDAWKPEDDEDESPHEVDSMLDDLTDSLETRGFVDCGGLTPAGRDLLARVEAAERPTYARAKALIDALNKDGGGFVVNGMLHAAIIAEANAKDAASTTPPATPPAKEPR